MVIFWMNKVSPVLSIAKHFAHGMAEQEELIGRLRQESETSNSIYYMGLQVVIGLSLLMYVRQHSCQVLCLKVPTA